MNAVSLENKTILVTGECEIIRGCHNRNKGTAENERLRDPKFIFSYPKNERLIFFGWQKCRTGRNLDHEGGVTASGQVYERTYPLFVLAEMMPKSNV